MIETRLFHYFLAIAREGNITRAAEQLFVTQSTLSKQMQDLENTLGKQLFIRGKRKITLTEEGEFFKSKAQEILQLVEQTESAFSQEEGILAGDIYIGAAEVPTMEKIAQLIKAFQTDHPDVRFHFISGDAEQIYGQIKAGLVDFGLILNPDIQDRFEYTQLPFQYCFGLLVPEAHQLTRYDSISAAQLIDHPLIVSQQFQTSSLWIERFGYLAEKLKVVASYNLLNNALYLAKENIGLLLALENVGLIETGFVFRPIEPTIEAQLYLVTKKYQEHSPALKRFLEELKEINKS
ncbi:TPA: LysR family transcriptional regulator [Streptococcus suis]|nr:LysR family transcriptional regulator [Streptococcus suis]